MAAGHDDGVLLLADADDAHEGVGVGLLFFAEVFFEAEDFLHLVDFFVEEEALADA